MEDLAAHDVVEPALPGPAAFLVVVVWNQREVRAEEHPVLVPDEVRIGQGPLLGERPSLTDGRSSRGACRGPACSLGGRGPGLDPPRFGLPTALRLASTTPEPGW